MAKLKAWCMTNPNYFINTSILDRDFDDEPANDNDFLPYSVKSVSPRDELRPSE